MTEVLPGGDRDDEPFDQREHEVRNALAAIKGNAQLLRRRLRAGSPLDVPQAVGYTEAIEAAAERIVRMVERWRGRVR